MAKDNELGYEQARDELASITAQLERGGQSLEESLALSWDEGAPFAIDLSGGRPTFRIQGEAQKARRDEVLPMTPDFAEWILATHESERHGRVFRLEGLTAGGPISTKRVGRLVAKMGRRARVVVNRTCKRVKENNRMGQSERLNGRFLNMRLPMISGGPSATDGLAV